MTGGALQLAEILFQEPVIRRIQLLMLAVGDVFPVLQQHPYAGQRIEIPTDPPYGGGTFESVGKPALDRLDVGIAGAVAFGDPLAAFGVENAQLAHLCGRGVIFARYGVKSVLPVVFSDHRIQTALDRTGIHIGSDLPLGPVPAGHQHPPFDLVGGKGIL